MTLSQHVCLGTQKTIPTTTIQDLDPRPCTDNAHASVLPLEMTAISEPDENPTRTLIWETLPFLIHIKRRTNERSFPSFTLGGLFLL
jgi:hypothetical protein